MDHRRLGRVFLLLGAAALLIAPAAWRNGVGGGECGDLEQVVNTGACVTGPGGNVIRNKGGRLLDISKCGSYHGRKEDEHAFHISSATSDAPFDISRDRNFDLNGDGQPDIAVMYDDGTIITEGTSGTNIDFVRAVKKFMLTHPDAFDVVHIFPNFNHAEGTFFVNIKNGIRGLGEPIMDDSATYGTAKLQGYAAFRNFVAYPTDLNARIPDNNDTTLTLLAHETAHRWGAQLHFDSDPSSRVRSSQQLLGRGLVHWCYFANLPSVVSASTSSSLEGNAWVDLGNGSFTTTNTGGTGGYSQLDQYIMGFRLASDVAATFTFQAAQGVTRTCADTPYTPEIDGTSPITVPGARMNVSIDDIIRIEGPRIPDASQAPRKLRAVFVILARNTPTDVPMADITKLNGIRLGFENYFLQQTEGIGQVVSTLGDVDFDADGFTTFDDCNDEDAAISPGFNEGPAMQTSCNHYDDDCDGFVDEGFDGDGDTWTTCNGDCNDTDDTISPDGIEVIGDLVDNDCDGLADNSVPVDQDFDGWSPPRDCNDGDAAVSPDGIEIVDGIDNNCNGFTDCDDPTVQKQSEKGPRRTDGRDNDCNDIIDG